MLVIILLPWVIITALCSIPITYLEYKLFFDALFSKQWFKTYLINFFAAMALVLVFWLYGTIINSIENLYGYSYFTLKGYAQTLTIIGQLIVGSTYFIIKSILALFFQKTVPNFQYFLFNFIVGLALDFILYRTVFTIHLA